MIRIEDESRTHLVDFPRRIVEQLERRAAYQSRRASGDERDILCITLRRLRAELRQQQGWKLTITGPTAWFVWLCDTLGDWETGYYLGRALELGRGPGQIQTRRASDARSIA